MHNFLCQFGDPRSNARGESKVRAREGVGRILRQNKASYQFVYKELRSHLKFWVNRTENRENG